MRRCSARPRAALVAAEDCDAVLAALPEPPPERIGEVGGPRRIEGKLGVHNHTFIPEGRFMWMGYKVKASVCLDCGFVAHYLDQADLPELGNRG